MAKAVKQANKARAQKAKTHATNTKARANDQAALKAIYLKEKDGLLLVDILAKAKSFVKYHNKIAQDGVGSKKTGQKYENGEDAYETIYLTNDQRAGHLDKSAGLQELIDYIERQTAMPTPTTKA